MADIPRKDTPYDPGIVDMLLGGINTAGQWLVRNVIPAAWFGPGQPLAPVAQDQADGRTWDYPTGQNLRFTPRGQEPVTFAQLRALAENYDLIRILIESRKDQVCKQGWTIKPKDEGAALTARAKEIRKFLEKPDLILPWDAWLRKILEDQLVLDAATVYPRMTKGGGLYSLDVIDGTTVTPLIDLYGRVPDPPSPAYQQIIKGVPAHDYRRDEIHYWPRNPRPGKVYGYGPVEQIIMTVNIGLRRQLTQLYTLTEGNVPEALIGVPEAWTPQQVKQFQTYWDEMLQGNLATKSRAKFVPGGVLYHEINKGELFGHADEWLARVTCYAFSISPQPFVKEQNRATASTAKETAEEEGLAPTMQWVKTFMDRIIADFFKAPDLEFAWKTEKEVDHLIQAQIDQIYINARVYKPEYVADRMGIDPKWVPEEPPPMPTGMLPPGGGQTPPNQSATDVDEGSKKKPLDKRLMAKWAM
jgi:hypothetical protein